MKEYNYDYDDELDRHQRIKEAADQQEKDNRTLSLKITSRNNKFILETIEDREIMMFSSLDAAEKYKSALLEKVEQVPYEIRGQYIRDLSR